MMTPVRWTCRHGRPAFSAKRRCRHPEAPPRGTRPCAGDPACPFRLPDHRDAAGQQVGPTLCPAHTDLAAIKLELVTYRELSLMMEDWR